MRFAKVKVLMLVFVMILLTMSGLPVFGVISVDSVRYMESEDGTYMIVIGANDFAPTLKIKSEVNGVPVKEIADSAFKNNGTVYKIVIPDSVEVIGKAAFRNCYNLVTIVMPSEIKEIPEYCFADNRVLKNIKFPDNLERIGESAFNGCSRLYKVNIPASVNYIGVDAFLGCESILFNAGENEYAAQYALDNSVNMDFKGTSAYFFIVMAVAVSAAFVLFILIVILGKHYISKYPEHNPKIYINRFILWIYSGFSIVGRVLKGFGLRVFGFFKKLFVKEK